MSLDPAARFPSLFELGAALFCSRCSPQVQWPRPSASNPRVSPALLLAAALPARRAFSVTADLRPAPTRCPLADAAMTPVTTRDPCPRAAPAAHRASLALAAARSPFRRCWCSLSSSSTPRAYPLPAAASVRHDAPPRAAAAAPEAAQPAVPPPTEPAAAQPTDPLRSLGTRRAARRARRARRPCGPVAPEPARGGTAPPPPRARPPQRADRSPRVDPARTSNARRAAASSSADAAEVATAEPHHAPASVRWGCSAVPVRVPGKRDEPVQRVVPLGDHPGVSPPPRSRPARGPRSPPSARGMEVQRVEHLARGYRSLAAPIDLRRRARASSPRGRARAEARRRGQRRRSLDRPRERRGAPRSATRGRRRPRRDGGRCVEEAGRCSRGLMAPTAPGIFRASPAGRRRHRSRATCARSARTRTARGAHRDLARVAQRATSTSATTGGSVSGTATPMAAPSGPARRRATASGWHLALASACASPLAGPRGAVRRAARRPTG